MLIKKFTVLLAAAVVVASVVDATGPPTAPRVHADVHRALRKQGTVNLLVTMQGGTGATLAAIKESEFATRGQRIASLVDSLESHSQQSQAQVSALLRQEAGTQQPLFSSSKQLWITNQVYIRDATFELVEKLAQLTSIAEIQEEEVLSIPKALAPTADSSAASNNSIAAVTPAWGVQMIQAPEVWAAGNTGQNVVVGVIDSGVRGTHEALRESFRGAYGWFDPEVHATEPYDKTGHGTHVAGSIVGGNGIGVAPGAKWMACKACRDVCLRSEMIECTQFMLCPTDTNGANKDCSKAPHVINNSWGAGFRGHKSSDEQIVAAWRAAGIIPVFSSGNMVPACGSVNSPSDYPDVIGVGATNSDDSLWSFSATGPADSGLIKPDVTAPGGAVLSASFTSDSAYKSDSGTSMAAPHVTGAIALLLSAKPNLTFDQVKLALTSSASRGVKTTGRTCGGTADTVFPNNLFGNGRINVFQALQK